MKIRNVIKNPFMLAIALGLIFLILLLSGGIFDRLTGPLIIANGTIFLIFINLGLPIPFKGLMINHLKFIITFSVLFLIVRLTLHDDFIHAFNTFLILFIWFTISSLIINILKNMKKGHWITIIILSFLTISFMIVSAIKDVELKKDRQFAEEAMNSEFEMRKVVKDQESKIDSLEHYIESLMTKK